MHRTTVMEVEFQKEECKAAHDDLRPNAVYRFACHVQWNNQADLKAYQVLITALDSTDEEVPKIAEALLLRKSPRPKSCSEYSVKAKSMGQEQRCLS